MLLIVSKDTAELDAEFVLGIEALKGVGTGREHAHVFKSDVTIDGQLVALEGCVMRRKNQRVADIPDADIAIGDVVHVAATAGVTLDAQAVVRSVDGEIIDQKMISSAVGPAAD